MADSSHPCSEGELEAKCAALQRQVDEMEVLFLGMPLL